MIYCHTFRGQLFGCGLALRLATRSARDPSVAGIVADADGFVRRLTLEIMLGPWIVALSTLPPVRVPSMKELLERQGKRVG